MKITAVCAIAILMVSLAGVIAAPAPVTLNAQDMPIQKAADSISEQAGAAIVVDPSVKGTVTASLKDADLTQVLDVITKSSNLVWKKISLAKSEGTEVTFDQMKAAAVALAAMPVIAMSVDDPATKTSAICAKDLPSAPDTALIKLPEKCSWVTMYVILAPPVAKDASAKTDDDTSVKSLSDSVAAKTLKMAELSSEERQQVYASEWQAQMSLSPEARQAMIRDQMSAMFNLDPEYREQLRQDMHEVFRDMRPDHGSQGE